MEPLNYTARIYSAWGLSPGIRIRVFLRVHSSHFPAWRGGVKYFLSYTSHEIFIVPRFQVGGLTRRTPYGVDGHRGTDDGELGLWGMD
jgi:hypothetical protein